MSDRSLPVRPDLDQLKHQAKDLLRALRNGDADALAEFRTHHPAPPEADAAKLADAQLALARAYGASSWPRLVHACELSEAIWAGDAATVRRLIDTTPALLHESVRLTASNWGAPMGYAATRGQTAIVRMLHEMGARDHEHALGRALLLGHTRTAELLHDLMGKPALPEDALGNPAYSLNVTGTQLAFAMGARVVLADGTQRAPIDTVLETDSRDPEAKHAILAMYEAHGYRFPDTAPMALHRGRIDLLAAHLARDADLLTRTFSHEAIYPPELGCHDDVLATHGTPLRGATLLHMAVDFDELEIGTWLLDQGMPVDARAAVDADGFGGHTALFATVVSQPAFWINYQHREPSAAFTRLLLARGADPNARASLRKQLHPGYGPDTLHEYRDVTPLGWGARFHREVFVNREAMRLIAEAGGQST
jgi:hypothetical protein